MKIPKLARFTDPVWYFRGSLVLCSVWDAVVNSYALIEKIIPEDSYEI
jgi:hypothetical protein